MRNISLRTRTIITIAFSVFFIFIFMFLGNLSLSKKQIKNRFTNEIEQFKSLSTGCLYLPIKENQTEIVSEVLSGLLQKQDAVCIEIYLANSPKDIYFAKQKIDGEIKEGYEEIYCRIGYKGGIVRCISHLRIQSFL